jgi:hypothetical protein
MELAKEMAKKRDGSYTGSHPFLYFISKIYSKSIACTNEVQTIGNISQNH